MSDEGNEGNEGAPGVLTLPEWLMMAAALLAAGLIVAIVAAAWVLVVQAFEWWTVPIAVIYVGMWGAYAFLGGTARWGYRRRRR